MSLIAVPTKDSEPSLYGKSDIGSIRTSSSSMIARGGLWVAKSGSSSFIATSSISGLTDGEDDGVSIAGAVERTALPDSTLSLVVWSSLLLIILEGDIGEGGEEGIDSSARAVRRLIVNLLGVASAWGCFEAGRVGVWGAEKSGSMSTSMALGSSRWEMESGMISVTLAASADLLLEPPRETRWRFREKCPSSSSYGFGLVEQGSEDAARSRDSSPGSWSIWGIRWQRDRSKRTFATGAQ